MVVELGLAGGHVPEDIMHDGNTLKAIIVEKGALILQIFKLLQRIFDLILFHECKPEVILSLEVFLNKFLLQFPHVG